MRGWIEWDDYVEWTSIGQSSILVINFGGLASEVCKTLVLAGIGHLYIEDRHTITEDDLCAQYFLRDKDVGLLRASCAKPRLSELNGNVKITLNSVDEYENYSKFDVVCITSASFTHTVPPIHFVFHFRNELHNVVKLTASNCTSGMSAE